MPQNAGAFVQPTQPGYSPYPTARQDSPFLRTPGAQGLQEGVTGGQGQAFTPTQEFFSGGSEGTAPPSSISPGAGMWDKFGGAGGAPSSFAQPQPQMTPQVQQSALGMAAALRGPGGTVAPPQDPYGQARSAYADLMGR